MSKRRHNPNITPTGTLTLLRKIGHMSAVSDGLPVPLKCPETGARPFKGVATRWLLQQRLIECKRRGEYMMFKITPAGVVALQNAELKVQEYADRARRMRGW